MTRVFAGEIGGKPVKLGGTGESVFVLVANLMLASVLVRLVDNGNALVALEVSFVFSDI